MPVHPGQVVGLLGASGSGKTTRAQSASARTAEPSAGRIVLDGELVYDGRWLEVRSPRRLRLQQIRLHLPNAQSTAVSGQHRQRRTRAPLGRPACATERRDAPSSCSTISSGWASQEFACPPSCPAARRNAPAIALGVFRAIGRPSSRPTSRLPRSIRSELGARHGPAARAGGRATGGDHRSHP